MNLRKQIIFLLLGSTIIVSSCRTRNINKPPELLATMDMQRVLDSIYTANPDVVGIMVHVEDPKDNISWSGAVGVSNKETKKPIEIDQPALIASNTKTYVSAAIMRLIEEGKFDLDSGIANLLPIPTRDLFEFDGYDLEKITVRHLLSHTSGIYNYVDAPLFFELLEKEPKHRWTREEQLTLSIIDGDPLGEAGDLYRYADTNYLLLTEILEKATNKAFYTAIRELINYEKLGMNDTWFETLESKPENTKERVTQYGSDMSIDSDMLEVSFDLYGGGGIASTTEDLSKFAYYLFNGEVFNEKSTLEQMLKKAEPIQAMEGDYRMGISVSKVNGLDAYGHGGFWGTTVNYFFELDASVSIFVLEREQRALRKDIMEGIVKVLQELDQEK